MHRGPAPLALMAARVTEAETNQEAVREHVS
jgi:hypothetical protein